MLDEKKIPPRNAVEAALITRFETEKAQMPGGSGIKAQREVAFARLAASGLPSRQIERYHYTDLRKWMPSEALQRNSQDRIAPPSFIGNVDAEITLIAGCLPLGEAPEGCEITSLYHELQKEKVVFNQSFAEKFEDPILDLNTAFCLHGLVIKVGDTSTRRVMHLACPDLSSEPGLNFSRLMIHVAPYSELTLIESHSGVNKMVYQQNQVVEFIVGEGAKVEYIRLNEAGDAAFQLSTLGVKLAKTAEFSAFSYVAGGRMVRHQTFATLEGEGAKIALSGASLIKGEQHIDHTLEILHQAPHGQSRELFRHVVDEGGRGVFQGKIMVEQGAQKTDGQMASNALLLSDNASMANKPELEIFADDVICAHGATCGSLDADQLFYLQARGLPKTEAEALLIEAFLGQAIDPITHEVTRGVIYRRIGQWLKKRVFNPPIG